MIHSTAYLGLHGQGSLNLTGPGDVIEAQHLVLSLFYAISVILITTSIRAFPLKDQMVGLSLFPLTICYLKILKPAKLHYKICKVPG